MALIAAFTVPAATATTVPATAGITDIGQPVANQPEPNNAEQNAAEIRTARQAAVDRVAGAATAFAEVPGYAGVAVDYEAAKVTISWKGTAPPAVNALAERVHGGVLIEVRRTAHSGADLHAASARLLDSQRTATAPLTVLTVLPAEDYAGLVVEISGDLSAQRAEALDQRLERVAGVPVRLQVIHHVVESTAGDRRDDRAPWRAGGAIATKDGTDYCTTGFSIVTGAGDHRIVTAAHCNKRVGDLVRDGAGQKLGTVTHRAPGVDAQLIDPVGDPETAGAVLGGPWDATRTHDRYQFPVATVQRPAVGQDICSSGAVTGEHCSTIRATDIAWTCGEETCHGFRASRDDGGVVVGGGDSGGPMYTVIDGTAYARGMIDGGSNRRSCGRTSVSTQCFSYVYGIPMVDILNHWDARIDS
jgi:V8-like Glu-specific endopeptidase